MGLFKAVGKATARSVSRQVTKSQVKKAPDKAYKQTGKEMAQARKQGKWVNGAAAYQKNKKANINKAYRNGKDRENFINDL